MGLWSQANLSSLVNMALNAVKYISYKTNTFFVISNFIVVSSFSPV